MKKWLYNFLVILLLILAACEKDGQPEVRTEELVTGMLLNVDTLPPVITAGTTYTLEPTTLYLLNRTTYVDSGATLVILPGVRIEGIKQKVPGSGSTLIVIRGGHIYAEGTASSPIIFTSHELTPEPGDWGGITINGNRPVVGGMEADAYLLNDSCGVLQYIQINYAGHLTEDDQTEAGLTVNNMDYGTQLDHIEVAYSGGNGFHFSGGNVTAQYLVALSSRGAGILLDNGYHGVMQFGLVARTADYVYQDATGITVGDKGLLKKEQSIPVKATISNFTITGGQARPYPGTMTGCYWKGNNGLLLENSIVMGYPMALRFSTAQPGMVIRDVQYNLLHGFTVITHSWAIPDISNDIQSTAIDANTHIQLSAPVLNEVRFLPYPEAGSPAATGATFYKEPGSLARPLLNSSISYRGAFAPFDRSWIDGWTTGL